MKTPFERRGASISTRHHLLYEKPQWHASQLGQNVSTHGSFVVRGVPRAHHDYLHRAIPNVDVPSVGVLSVMYEIAQTYKGWKSDEHRLEHMLDDMTGFAHNATRPHQAHEMWTVASSIAGQMAVVKFMGGAFRYE